MRDEFDLLFGAIDQAPGELARGLLNDRGIPSMLHAIGIEADISEGPQVSRWFQLFVPKGKRAVAREHVAAVWGARAVNKLDPTHAPTSRAT